MKYILSFQPLRNFLAIALLFGALPLVAQIENGAIGYYADAGQFNRVTRGGTARSIGIGNATTALGGDMGVTTTNPAGLGFYRRSELNFSPVIGVSGGKTNYLGNENGESKGYFGVSNMGAVIALPSANDKGYKGGALSFGMNRVNNFQNKVAFTGVNSKNNFGDYLVQSAEGTPQSNLYTAASSGAIYDLITLAYATYLIDPYSVTSPNDTKYHTFYQKDDIVQQKGILTNKGAQYDWYAAYGANFSDKLYVGLSVDMSTLRREQNYAYIETAGVMKNGAFEPQVDTLIDMTYYNNLKTTGTGISFGGGVVWKPSKVIRLGVSMRSPTFFAMKDTYNEQIVTNFKPIPLIPLQGNYNYSTIQGVFKYNYRSPMRASAGVAIFLGKKGFITGDVEVVPYADAKYTGKDKTVNTFAFEADNKTIKNIYTTALNLRTGAEFRTNSGILFRGGFGYLSDPTNGFDGTKRNMIQFSGGLGFRGDNEYIDFALVNTRSTGYYQPYTMKNNTQPGADIKYITYALVISGGVYF